MGCHENKRHRIVVDHSSNIFSIVIFCFNFLVSKYSFGNEHFSSCSFIHPFGYTT